jgi:sulfur-carrier protein
VSVIFHIPGALRDFTGGRTHVEIEASPGVLGDALKALWTRYPGIRDRIATEQGQIRQHINVFVGNENVRYTGGLATPIPAGSEISIVPAVSGGSSVRRPGTQRLLLTGPRSTGKRKRFNATT